MKKHIILTFIGCCLFFGNIIAQNDFQSYSDSESKGVVYNKEFTIDIRTHTNGLLALAANFGQIKTYYKTKYYHFEIGELKHNKEYRTRDLAPQNNGRIASSFVYGKQNNFYVVRGGLGTKKYITDKARQKGLAVGINYEYGPSLGLIKPYYVNINASDSGNSVRAIKYTPENAANFLDYNDIAGHAGFTKGLGELSVVPGINGKFGLLLDWGAFDEFVKAVEVGIMADVFFKTIPIMVDDIMITDPNITPVPVNITPENIRNRPFFINLYISLQLGKRSQ